MITTILPASQRPPTVSPGGRTCYAFQWIGQRFDSCDNCGRPFWHHSHTLTRRASSRPFRKIITVEQAVACWRKWGR